MKVLLLIVVFAGMVMPLSALAQSKAGMQPQSDHTKSLETSCNELEYFKARMHQAIYDALKYSANFPYSVTKGVTSIRYNYLNGNVVSVKIITSSGTNPLDRAAVRAVRDAQYPPVPAALRDKEITDLVYIVFDNTGTLATQGGTPESRNAISRQEDMDARCVTKSKS
ncbi:MAG: energy transducer TonB [Gammaproteobacteria bacterium]